MIYLFLFNLIKLFIKFYIFVFLNIFLDMSFDRELKVIGFDQLTEARAYKTLLDEVHPDGASQFTNAYAYGIGHILNFNEKFVKNAKGNANDLQIPQYLHIVIGTEHEADGRSKANKDDV